MLLDVICCVLFLFVVCIVVGFVVVVVVVGVVGFLLKHQMQPKPITGTNGIFHLTRTSEF